MNFEGAARTALQWTAVMATVMIVLVGSLYVLANIMLLVLIFAISFAVFALSNDTIGLAKTIYQQVVRNEYSQIVLRKLHQVTGDNIVQDLNNQRNPR